VHSGGKTVGPHTKPDILAQNHAKSKIAQVVKPKSAENAKTVMLLKS
jgi:hypothetical protein